MLSLIFFSFLCCPSLENGVCNTEKPKPSNNECDLKPGRRRTSRINYKEEGNMEDDDGSWSGKSIHESSDDDSAAYVKEERETPAKTKSRSQRSECLL
jgi:hypothetical protein